jgi:hypothetical protein
MCNIIVFSTFIGEPSFFQSNKLLLFLLWASSCFIANVIRRNDRVLQQLEVSVRDAVHTVVALLLHLREVGEVGIAVGDEEVAFALEVRGRAGHLAALLGQTLLGGGDGEEAKGAVARLTGGRGGLVCRTQGLKAGGRGRGMIAFVVGAGGARAVTSEGEREEGAKAHNSETHKKFHQARKKITEMIIQDNTK